MIGGETGTRCDFMISNNINMPIVNKLPLARKFLLPCSAVVLLSPCSKRSDYQGEETARHMVREDEGN